MRITRLIRDLRDVDIARSARVHGFNAAASSPQEFADIIKAASILATLKNNSIYLIYFIKYLFLNDFLYIKSIHKSIRSHFGTVCSVHWLYVIKRIAG